MTVFQHYSGKMTFKANWEKTDKQIQLKPETIASMASKAFPNVPLLSYEVLSQGCANLNIKIVLKSGTYNLRIYLRNREAAYREAHIASFMKFDIPIPEVFYIGDHTEDLTTYLYVITKFMEGIPLRDLLLNYPESNWQNIMVDVGAILSEFRRLSFPHAGFFDEHFNIPKPFQPKDLICHIDTCLSNQNVQKALGNAMLQKLQDIFAKHSDYFPNESDATLVHGDFDPANILVHRIDDTWRISAILDWEFAFAGSFLWDVANMLRYAHHMPHCYQESFIKGIQEAGLELPENWQKTVALLNLSSLLDILSRHSIQEHPKQSQDISQLIKHHTSSLSA
ncbi:MAG: aminoglycoside phosphotransferase family protein [Alphaproteobacteria bacterium]|nr:aminoglycoside phosphotransferase family protein [Alphaproteobacteria bacterium]